MSRSYKKVPYCGDKKGKQKKRAANHKVRSWLKQNPDFILKRNNYKKLYERYDICDYYWITSLQEYIDNEMKTYLYYSYMYPSRFKEPLPNKKELYRKWYKYYKMK